MGALRARSPSCLVSILAPAQSPPPPSSIVLSGGNLGQGTQLSYASPRQVSSLKVSLRTRMHCDVNLCMPALGVSFTYQMGEMAEAYSRCYPFTSVCSFVYGFESILLTIEFERHICRSAVCAARESSRYRAVTAALPPSPPPACFTHGGRTRQDRYARGLTLPHSFSHIPGTVPPYPHLLILVHTTPHSSVMATSLPLWSLSACWGWGMASGYGRCAHILPHFYVHPPCPTFFKVCASIPNLLRLTLCASSQVNTSSSSTMSTLSPTPLRCLADRTTPPLSLMTGRCSPGEMACSGSLVTGTCWLPWCPGGVNMCGALFTWRGNGLFGKLDHTASPPAPQPQGRCF